MALPAAVANNEQGWAKEDGSHKRGNSLDGYKRPPRSFSATAPLFTSHDLKTQLLATAATKATMAAKLIDKRFHNVPGLYWFSIAPQMTVVTD